MLIKPSNNSKNDKLLLNYLSKDLHRSSPYRNKQPKPMLVISYDDAPLTDYTLAFDVHKEYNVPGELSVTSGVFTDGVFQFSFGEHMSIEQIKEMRDFGFEIAGHGKNHMRIGATSLAENTPAGSTEIKPAQSPRVQPKIFPMKWWLWDRNSGREQIVTVVGITDDEEKFIIEEPLKYGFPIWGTFMSLHEEEIEKEVGSCFNELMELGIPAAHYSYPHNDSSWYSRKVVKKYFNSARSGTTEGKNIVLPNVTDEPLNTYKIIAHPELANKTTDYIDDVLDSVAESKALAISFEHTWTFGFNPQTLAYIFEQCENKGIEIVTRSKALEHFGNLIEIGDVDVGLAYMDDPAYYIVDKFGKEFTNMVNVDLTKV